MLEKELARCRAEKILVLAVVGVAGTTETGAVDDLEVGSPLTAHAHSCQRGREAHALLLFSPSGYSLRACAGDRRCV